MPPFTGGACVHRAAGCGHPALRVGIGGLLHIGRRGEGGTFKDKMDAAAAQPPRSELKGSAVQTKMDATAA